jgi:hypothetical protein
MKGAERESVNDRGVKDRDTQAGDDDWTRSPGPAPGSPQKNVLLAPAWAKAHNRRNGYSPA